MDKMKAISRRSFLQVAGITMLAAAIPVAGEKERRRGEKRVRVRPLSSSRAITSSEKAFCQRARFFTPADAMRAAASRRMAVEIYVK